MPQAQSFGASKSKPVERNDSMSELSDMMSDHASLNRNGETESNGDLIDIVRYMSIIDF